MLTMARPTVSFVVPCYKLGHLLAECINSILAQTYPDFEILIMDDCSPDDTGRVASSFQDSRVQYIRNDHNLGLIENFNKGIRTSVGKYIWIISADDYLRAPYVLDRYVQFMEGHPTVGYVFCPAVTVNNGRETGIQGTYGDRDRLLAGHDFLKALLEFNRVTAGAAMARRVCYETLSYLPGDIKWAGASVDTTWIADWYLWCLFALSFDVGYLAEPMVAYREHDLSITSTATRQDNVDHCARADIAVPWVIKAEADRRRLTDVSRHCLGAIARAYASHRMSKQYRSGTSLMTPAQFEESLCRSTNDERQRERIEARVAEAMADRLFWSKEFSAARGCYSDALQHDRWLFGVRTKLLLLSLGTPGIHARRLILALRRSA